MKRPIFVQPPFKTLVSNLKGGSDPSKGVGGNPVKARVAFEQSNVTGARLNSGIKAVSPSGIDTANPLTYDLILRVVEGGGYEVANELMGDSVYLGEVEIKEGLHFDGTTGNDNATAGDLASAINRISGYVAVADNNLIYIAGSFGTDNPHRYEAKVISRIGASNFTLSTDEVVFSNRVFALSHGIFEGANAKAGSRLANMRGPKITN